MDKTDRKSITLKKKNIEEIEKLIEKGIYKNFSYAINEAVEDKIREDRLDKCEFKDIPKDVSFADVVKKVIKGFKNEH